MRFMMILKANPRSESGLPPDDREYQVFSRYNADLIKAGVLLDAVGLLASAKGARVDFAPGKISVVDGPFAEMNELIAGFWMIEVRSKDEAVEWARRCPLDPHGSDARIELRQVLEASDVGTARGADRARKAP